jgi:MFS family permease
MKSSIFVYWTPSKERTVIIGASTAGAWVGNIVALPLAGYLCVNGFDEGWPSIFYIFGIVGVVWSIAFHFLCADTPKNHIFISEIEKNYIIEETQSAVAAKENGPLVNLIIQTTKYEIQQNMTNN